MKFVVPFSIISVIALAFSLVLANPTGSQVAQAPDKFTVTDLNNKIFAAINNRIKTLKLAPGNTVSLNYNFLVKEFTVDDTPFKAAPPSPPDAEPVTQFKVATGSNSNTIEEIISKVPEKFVEFLKALSVYYLPHLDLLTMVDNVADNTPLIDDIKKKQADFQAAQATCAEKKKEFEDECTKIPEFKSDIAAYKTAVEMAKTASTDAGIAGWKNFYFIRNWCGTKSYFDGVSEQKLVDIGSKMVKNNNKQEFYTAYDQAKAEIANKFKIFLDSFIPVANIAKTILGKSDKDLEKMDPTMAEQLLVEAKTTPKADYEPASVIAQIKKVYGEEFKWTIEMSPMKESYKTAIKTYINEAVAAYIINLPKHLVPIVGTTGTASNSAASTSTTSQKEQTDEPTQTWVIVFWIVTPTIISIAIVSGCYWYYASNKRNASSDSQVPNIESPSETTKE